MYDVLLKIRHQTRSILLKYILLNTPRNESCDFAPILRMQNPRKIWMEPRSVDWWERIVLNHFTNEKWLENFRVSKETFLWLCDLLREELSHGKNYVRSRQPLTVEKQVAVCLFFLASCAEYRVVANLFGVSKTSVWKCVHRVVDAINNVLMDSYLKMPNSDEASEIALFFEKKTHIPQLIGAIDGTHIPVLPPSDGYRDFINRKGWPSIILQAVVDHKFRFRNISVGVPGSAHDSNVFKRSAIYRKHKKLIPQDTKLIEGRSVPYMLTGDPAYPLLQWVLKGYTKHNNLTLEKESFNVNLSSGRVYVEIAFGKLKSRWRCLLKRLDVHYTFVPKIISACCILHNIVETKKDTFVKAWEQSVEDAQLLFPQPPAHIDLQLDNFDASLNRDFLMEQLSRNFPLGRSLN